MAVLPMHSFKAKLLSGFIWKRLLYVSAFLLNLAVALFFGAAGAGWFYLPINDAPVVKAPAHYNPSEFNKFTKAKITYVCIF